MRYVIYKENELQHHGVDGMKWGIRRYQNPDGSYKPGFEGRYAPDYNKKGRTKSDNEKGNYLGRTIKRRIKANTLPAASVLAGMLGSAGAAAGVSAACAALFPITVPAVAALAATGMIVAPALIGSANAVRLRVKYSVEDKKDLVKSGAGLVKSKTEENKKK